MTGLPTGTPPRTPTGTVIVIGADGGLGNAVVACLAARGTSFVATVRTPARLGALVGPLARAAAVRVLDLSDPEAVVPAVRDLCIHAGRVDAVIVCAAVPAIGALEHVDYATLRRAVAINCLACASIYQGAVDALRNTSGRIIFTSSVTGRVASPLQGAYAASKFALEGAADVMRQEAAPGGVDIILVEPGGIATPMVTAAIADAERGRAVPGSARGLYRAFAGMARAAVDAGTLSTPDEVARTVVAALDDAEPQTRYVVGKDAAALLEARKLNDDRALDAVLLQAFGVTAG